jgi:hypothetical protein
MKPTRIALWFTFVAFAWGNHPLSATEIPDRALVKIESQVSGSRQAGTGFIVKKTSDGVYILTAAHVVAGDPKPKVYFTRLINQAVPVDRVYMEGAKDEGLAVLFVVRSKIPTDLLALPLANTGPESHQEYHVVGYPRAVGFLSVISGRATRKGSYVVFLAELGDGFSGSPMLRDERVYGIVVTSAANALAVPVDIARVFLKGAGIDAPPPCPWRSSANGARRAKATAVSGAPGA